MNTRQIPSKLTAVRLRQLQLFDVAANLGSISEAARQLNISQPAATEMLKGLERAFSVQLFIGTSKGIVLTESGKRVASRATAALRELQTAVDEAGEDVSVGGVLRIALAPTSMYSSVPQAIQAFTEANPRVLLNLRELNVADTVAALNDDEVDLAITANDASFAGGEGRERMVVHPLSLDHYELVASHRLKLPDDWRPTPTNLRALHWILPIKQSFLRGLFDDWFLARGTSPPSSFIELTPLTTAIEMLRTFPYVTILPSGLLRSGIFEHLMTIPDNPFSLPIRLVVACKENQLDRGVVSAFIQEVMAVCGSD